MCETPPESHPGEDIPQNQEPRGTTGRPAHLLLYGAVLAQFYLVFYPPGMFLPEPQYRDAGDRLIRLVQNYEGPVLLPDHGYLARRAGKPTTAHGMAVYDLVRSRREEVKEKFVREVRRAILMGRFSAVIVPTYPEYFGFEKEIEQAYQPAGRIMEREGVLAPPHGLPNEPAVIYVPRRVGKIKGDFAP
jgi:hypothetical protein